MIQYILRKLLLALPLLWGVVTLIFVLLQVSPGDATDRFFTPETPPEVREMIMVKWGLDQPVHVQYGRMLGNLATGDFGISIAQERPVFDIISEKLPNTLLLSAVTLSVVIVTGLSLGIAQAIRQYSLFDNMGSVVSLFFYSMPSFWLARSPKVPRSSPCARAPGARRRFIFPARWGGSQMMSASRSAGGKLRTAAALPCSVWS